MSASQATPWTKSARSTTTRTGSSTRARPWTSSGACSPRARIRASGRTSPPGSPTGGRSASSPPSSAASLRRRWPTNTRLTATPARTPRRRCRRRTPTSRSSPTADPSHLKPVLERFRETPFVLLHCYPFVREAGWLAHVYGNVWFDLSLTIPHVSRPAEMVRQALELAPVSKLLYASDAARTPELYYLAAKWWREALADVLTEALSADEAEAAGRQVLRENAGALYGP